MRLVPPPPLARRRRRKQWAPPTVVVGVDGSVFTHEVGDIASSGSSPVTGGYLVDRYLALPPNSDLQYPEEVVLVVAAHVNNLHGKRTFTYDTKTLLTLEPGEDPVASAVMTLGEKQSALAGGRCVVVVQSATYPDGAYVICSPGAHVPLDDGLAAAAAAGPAASPGSTPSLLAHGSSAGAPPAAPRVAVAVTTALCGRKSGGAAAAASATDSATSDSDGFDGDVEADVVVVDANDMSLADTDVIADGHGARARCRAHSVGNDSSEWETTDAVATQVRRVRQAQEQEPGDEQEPGTLAEMRHEQVRFVVVAFLCFARANCRCMRCIHRTVWCRVVTTRLTYSSAPTPASSPSRSIGTTQTSQQWRRRRRRISRVARQWRRTQGQGRVGAVQAEDSSERPGRGETTLLCCSTYARLPRSPRSHAPTPCRSTPWSGAASTPVLHCSSTPAARGVRTTDTNYGMRCTALLSSWARRRNYRLQHCSASRSFSSVARTRGASSGASPSL